ncbi:type VI secretion system contractile sheath small subunit [Pseudomonas sp. S1_G07]
MPNDDSLDSRASAPLAEVHVGYLAVPPLDRLMRLRDALVALKGPLVSDAGLQENLRRRLFNEEAHDRMLGKRTTSSPA